MSWEFDGAGSVFEASQIPMAVVDSERRYVRVNDAALAVFGYARGDLIGAKAARTARHTDPLVGSAQWAELVRTNQLYGELVVEHSSGTPIRVSFGAHALSENGEWLALLVALSAQLEDTGIPLIRTFGPDASSAPGGLLTGRECEIVRHVALGQSSPEIAALLFLSPNTVRTHIKKAMAKTEARTRAQLVAIALTRGLIEP
jgi:PAS domain S-box-containing protein